MSIPHMGSGRSSSTVVVNTHIPPSAALLVSKMTKADFKITLNDF